MRMMTTENPEAILLMAETAVEERFLATHFKVDGGAVPAEVLITTCVDTIKNEGLPCYGLRIQLNFGKKG